MALIASFSEGLTAAASDAIEPFGAAIEDTAEPTNGLADLRDGLSGVVSKANNTVSGQQIRPDVAILADGTFVVAWVTVNGPWGVSFQRFSNTGDKIGSEVVAQTHGHPGSVSVHPLADGSFELRWLTFGFSEISGFLEFSEFYNRGGVKQPSGYISPGPWDGEVGTLGYTLPTSAFGVTAAFAQVPDGLGGSNVFIRVQIGSDASDNFLLPTSTHISAALTDQDKLAILAILNPQQKLFPLVIDDRILLLAEYDGGFAQLFSTTGESLSQRVPLDNAIDIGKIVQLSHDKYAAVGGVDENSSDIGLKLFDFSFLHVDTLQPTVSIAALDSKKPEGDAGTTAFVFEVKLSDAIGADTSVDWKLELPDGVEAASINDFLAGTSTSGQVTIPAGATSATLSIQVIGDTFLEWADEFFSVVLKAVSGGVTIANAASTAQASIQEDDYGSESSGLRYPVGNAPAARLNPAIDGDGWFTIQDLGTLNTDLQPHKRHPGLPFYHLGEDWNAEVGQDKGEAVYSIYEGKVAYVKENHAGFGNVIVLSHNIPGYGEIFSLYAHLNSITPKLTNGAQIGKGFKIGEIGNTPDDFYFDPHLHFEIFSTTGNATASNYLINGTPNHQDWGYTHNEDAHFGENNDGITSEFSYTEGSFTWFNPSAFIEKNLTIKSDHPINTKVSTKDIGGSFYGTILDDRFSITTPSQTAADIGIFKQGADILVQMFDSGKKFLLKAFEEISIAGGDKNDSTVVGDLIGTSISQNTIHFSGGRGDDVLDASSVDRRIIAEGGGDNDKLTGGSGNDLLDGGLGFDIIEGGQGNDKLKGGNGADILSGGTGSDDLTGGNDDDTLNGDDGNDLLTGGNGADILLGGDDNDRLEGGNGADILKGGTGIDNLAGGNDDDTLNGDDGNDLLTGGNGDDYLRGGNGDDTLNGGNGADILEGGAGQDILTGGNGSDSFVFRPGFGQETITDFRAVGSQHDFLQFETDLFADKTDLFAHSVNLANGILITSDAGDTLLVKNITIVQLQAHPEDLHFV